MYDESYSYQPQGQQPSAEFPPSKEVQIDDKIISSNVKENYLTIEIPEFEKKVIAIILKDKYGKPVLIDGQYLYEEKEMQVFTKFVEKKINFPLKDYFSDNVSSSFLDPLDVEIIRNADLLVSTLISKMVKEGKSYPRILTKLKFIKHTVATTSKGLRGVAATTAKTRITKGETIEKIINEQKQILQKEEEKKKGLFSFLGR